MSTINITKHKNIAEIKPMENNRQSFYTNQPLEITSKREALLKQTILKNIWEKISDKTLQNTGLALDCIHYKIDQHLFKDIKIPNNNYYIFQITSETNFFSIYIDITFIKEVLASSFSIVPTDVHLISDSELIDLFLESFFKINIANILIKENLISKNYKLKISKGGIESHKEISGNSTYVLFSFITKLNDSPNLGSFIFAFTKDNLSMIKHLKEKCSMINLDNEFKSTLKSSITAHLGCTNVLLGDLQKLQQGDVLLLSKKISEPVKILLSDDCIFYGEIGKQNNKLAVMLKELVLDVATKDKAK